MLVIFCLLGLMTGAQTMICSKEFCDNITCEQVTADTCEGTFRPRGDLCGCCDICVQRKGLRSASSGPCAQELARVTAIIENSKYPPLGLERPLCDDDGYFMGMQYSGAMAVCVTRDGTWLYQYSVYRWQIPEDASCQCARDEYDSSASGENRLFHCEHDGSYANSESSRAVAKKTVGPCAQELARVTAIIENSKYPPLGLERPLCDDDGYFMGMQYSGAMAVCVTKDGKQMFRYAVNRWEMPEDTSCQCARDEYENDMQGGDREFHCARDGSYGNV